jgi:hypothetical protein
VPLWFSARNLTEFQETIQRLPRCVGGSELGFELSETEPVRPESPAFYRAKAQEIFQQAERATTEETRAELLALAEHWQRLAQRAELSNE